MLHMSAKYSGPCVPGISTRIATVLIALAVDILGLKREAVSVSTEFVPRSEWFTGGLSVTAAVLDPDMAALYLDVNMQTQASTKEQIADYMAKTFMMIEPILGKLHPSSFICFRKIEAESCLQRVACKEFRYSGQDAANRT
jgi:hypothetical protein